MGLDGGQEDIVDDRSGAIQRHAISKRADRTSKTPRAHSEAAYRLGSDRGSRTMGTLLSKRVTGRSGRP